MSDITTKTTHELWMESRKFAIDVSRPSPTTLQVAISYPAQMSVVEGAVVTLDVKAVNSFHYPEDGEKYVASTDLLAPASKLADAQVIGFFSEILGNPLPNSQTTPAAAYNPTTGMFTFTILVTNANPAALYHASVHGCSNVLQYYPFGVQSYPLEAAPIEKRASTFTGSIPTLLEAPTNPTMGFVYHDRGLNIVQYWNGSYWIPTRADSIATGAYNPGTLGQVYFHTGGQSGGLLRVFAGGKWNKVDNTNFMVKANTGNFIPIGAISANINQPTGFATGDFYYNYTTQRFQYFDGSDWVYPSSSNTLYTGGPTTPCFFIPATVEPVELQAPAIGELFYNTTTKLLNVWTGSGWIQANTDQQGTPTSDKFVIGTDGSYNERIRLINIMKVQLGYPTLCVELDEAAFNSAIDNALDNYRAWSDNAYTRKYILYLLTRGQQTYYLNSATDGTDKIVGIQKIHRLNVLGPTGSSWDGNVYMQTFLTNYYNATTADTLSVHLMHSLAEDYERLFAGNLTFTWDEPTRELFLTRRVANNEKVLIEAYCERTEQEIILDRWAKQFIQNWALAECKMALGLIRSKFSSGTPGPAGTINLNGELLVTEARQDMTELREQLYNNEYGSGGINHGNLSFLIG